jgi:hypothetical protein
LISPVLLNAAVIAAVLGAAILFFSPRFSRSDDWRAMVTPLASIIGSGFLVLGPILDVAYGAYAPLAMAALCLGAYAFGDAIRFNIAAIDDAKSQRGRVAEALEVAASWALAFAYIISVAYYLNLFGAFGVSLTPVDDATHAKLLTSAIFVFTLFVGWTRGFKSLEHLEYFSVTLKLAIIAGLLVGLTLFVTGRVFDGGLIFNPPEVSPLAALTLGFGLIVTVQGFETSRYLGATYGAGRRIRSMKLAQWVSGGIYLIYIALVAYIFERGEMALSETAIIDMMAVVAPILPAILVAAALAAQFSAAVADTSGSGGLFEELTRGRVSARQGYLLLTVVGLALTWTANVFEIISYASRAFALYYMLQAAIAGVTALRTPGRKWRAAGFLALALLGALIVLFGKPVEG